MALFLHHPRLSLAGAPVEAYGLNLNLDPRYQFAGMTALRFHVELSVTTLCYKGISDLFRRCKLKAYWPSRSDGKSG